MKRYVVEVASANLEHRPGRGIDSPNDDNWEVIASGQTPQQALISLLEACNDEVVSLDNNWLRLKIKDDESKGA